LSCNIIIIHHHVVSLLWELKMWQVSANSNKWCHLLNYKTLHLKQVGVMFIKLWYIIIIIINNNTDGKILEIFLKIITGKMITSHIIRNNRTDKFSFKLTKTPLAEMMVVHSELKQLPQETLRSQWSFALSERLQ